MDSNLEPDVTSFRYTCPRLSTKSPEDPSTTENTPEIDKVHPLCLLHVDI